MIKRFLTLLLIGGFYQCSSSQGEADGTDKTESIPVRIVQLNTESYSSYHRGTGKLNSDRTVRLIFEVPGRVEHIFKKTGNSVKKGEIIAQLKDDTYNAQYDLAKTAFEKAKHDLKNSESLHKKNAISEDNLLQTRLGKTKAQADLVLAKNAFDNTKLIAPFNGHISYINLQAGEYFNPAAMNEIPVIVSDMDSLVVETSISAKFISQININDSVDFSLKNVNSVNFSGIVHEVGLMPLNMGNSYKISMSVFNPPGTLRLGMLVDFKIKTNSMDNVFLLPNKYILEDKQGAYIHILQDNKAKRKAIRLLKTDGNISLIKELLPTGTLLITDGTRKVSDGLFVRTVE